MTNLAESQEPMTEVMDQAETGLAASEETPVEASQPNDEAPAEPEYDYFDPTEVGDKYVKVRVDGEEVSVPLSEALQGYQRQADYTKKTQELAAQRQEAENALRLAQSVQANPGLTMQVLASQAGMSVEQFLNLTPAQQQQAAANAEPEYSDPMERALAEERQARLALQEKFEQREADEILHRAIGGLQQQLGATEEDVRAVVSQALQMGVGPEMFPMIYQSQQYQKTLAQQQAQTQSQQQTAAAEQQRQAAARQAQQVVSQGSGVVGTAPASVAGQPMTIAEAAAAALDQFGVT